MRMKMNRRSELEDAKHFYNSAVLVQSFQYSVPMSRSFKTFTSNVIHNSQFASVESKTMAPEQSEFRGGEVQIFKN